MLTVLSKEKQEKQREEQEDKTKGEEMRKSAMETFSRK